MVAISLELERPRETGVQLGFEEGNTALKPQLCYHTTTSATGQQFVIETAAETVIVAAQNAPHIPGLTSVRRGEKLGCLCWLRQGAAKLSVPHPYAEVRNLDACVGKPVTRAGAHRGEIRTGYADLSIVHKCSMADSCVAVDRQNESSRK